MKGDATVFDKSCPLLGEPGHPCVCKKELCAWWESQRGQCCVVTLAQGANDAADAVSSFYLDRPVT